MQRTSRWLVVVFALLAFAPGSAAGEEWEQAEPTKYRGLVTDGLREFSLHNYEEARALFLQAHAIYPNARTHRALGLAEFELKNYAASVRRLERALACKVRPLPPTLRDEVSRLLVRAYGFVARIQVVMQPVYASLFVDGVETMAGPYRTILLNLGSHELEVATDGYSSERRTLLVLGGEQLFVEFVLREGAAAGPSAALHAEGP